MGEFQTQVQAQETHANVIMSIRTLHLDRLVEWNDVTRPIVDVIGEQLPCVEDEDEDVNDKELEALENRLKELGYNVFRIGDRVFVRVSSNTLIYITYMLDDDDDKIYPVAVILYFPTIPPAMQRRILEDYMYAFPDYYDPCTEIVVYDNGVIEYRDLEGNILHVASLNIQP